jgi:hypothetical protein
MSTVPSTGACVRPEIIGAEDGIGEGNFSGAFEFDRA